MNKFRDASKGRHRGFKNPYLTVSRDFTASLVKLHVKSTCMQKMSMGKAHLLIPCTGAAYINNETKHRVWYNNFVFVLYKEVRMNSNVFFMQS